MLLNSKSNKDPSEFNNLDSSCNINYENNNNINPEPGQDPDDDKDDFVKKTIENDNLITVKSY